MALAAVLRVLVELLTLPFVLWSAKPAAGLRKVLERLARLAYFVGVPVWLLLRIVSG